jgi:hypothetical protein
MIAALEAPATRNRTTYESDLIGTLNQILGMASMNRDPQRVLSRLVRRESYFSLENDPQLIGPLVDLLLQKLAGMGVGNETVRLQVGVALQEALSNALYHGNLELSSDLRQDDERRFYALARERRSLDPYRERRVHVHATVDRDSATFVIRDEGPGFDVSQLDRPIDPEDLMRIGGRGLLLIRTFMDEVSYNSTGNEITLVKRCRDARRGPSACAC